MIRHLGTVSDHRAGARVDIKQREHGDFYDFTFTTCAGHVCHHSLTPVELALIYTMITFNGSSPNAPESQ